MWVSEPFLVCRTIVDGVLLANVLAAQGVDIDRDPWITSAVQESAFHAPFPPDRRARLPIGRWVGVAWEEA
jgi:hypothetical protein